MLPKAQRLTKDDFKTLEKGKRSISAHFSCTKQPSSFLKVAIIISKKAAKKAVDRHLLKRRVSAVIHKNPPPAGYYCIYARTGSNLLPYSQIVEEITALLRK